MKRLVPENPTALQEKANALVTVNVRRPEESGAGHVEGTVHTPTAEWRRLTERPVSGPGVTCCTMDHPGFSLGEQRATQFAELGAHASVRAASFLAWPASGAEGARAR